MTQVTKPNAKPHARRGGKAQRSRPSNALRGAPKRPRATLTGQPVGFHANVIGHAEILLGEVLQFDMPADGRLSRYFKANPMLGHRDRGLIAESIFAVLRRKLEYAQLAQSGTGSLARRMILLGLADTAGVEPIAATLDADERTWLRRVATIDRTTMSLATRSNLPEWLFARLRERFGEAEVEAIAATLNRPAPLDLRVNTMRTSRADALTAMRTAGLDAAATALAPNGIRLAGKPALAAQQIFVDGRVEVQDEGSQLLASLVAPKRGELVIDFCAGAGGKTLALGDLMRSTGRLYAFDVSAKRLAKLKPRLARSGLSNVHPVQIESERDPKLKRMAGRADRVLIDAPCSGLGTLRRNPDLKWRQSPETIAELAVKQASILASAARLVKPGGRLVYATCSLLGDENHAIVDGFLASRIDFEVESATDILVQQGIALGKAVDANAMLELWPHRTGTDGFFAAVLRRRSTAPAEPHADVADADADIADEKLTRAVNAARRPRLEASIPQTVTDIMDADDFNSLLLDTWKDLHRPQLLWQLGVIAGCFVVAWLVARVARGALKRRGERYVEIDPERNAALLRTRFAGLDRLLTPLFLWALLVAGERVMHVYKQPAHLVRIVAILAIAYVGIHLGLYTLRRVFKPSPGMMLIERWFGILAWLLVALNVTGLLPDVIATLSGPEASFTIGKNLQLSVWQLLSAFVWIGITLVTALGIGSVLESRLMRSESIDASMRIVFARLGKAVLVIVAVLVAMRLVDIDITVLSVFGGALGVGLGLGLQRIASNYVSGFIILLDRSLRIGDVITVDKYTGSVTQIRTRCTVVRAPNGVEALVPNELLLNQAVQNFSYGDKNGNAVTRIRVAYDTDIDDAMQRMLDAAYAQDRVLKDPAATVTLKEFGADGIELELTFWVPDPETGTDVVRSDINRAIWRSFQQAGIQVPFPQREVRMRADQVFAGSPAAAA